MLVYSALSRRFEPLQYMTFVLSGFSSEPSAITH